MHETLAALISAVGLAVAGWGFSILLSENSPFLSWVGASVIVVGLAIVVADVALLAGPLLRKGRNGVTDMPAAAAIALIERGDAAQQQGQYPEAINYLQQALDIYREVGDRAGEGATPNTIGAAHRSQGKSYQALNRFQQSLVIAREVGSKELEGTVLANIDSLTNPSI